jgi:sugar O-acyltransferase (sialic acid O-acetyltransferase NeuD family)
MEHALSDKIPILLFGASGHARVIADIVRRQGRYAVAGIVLGSWGGSPRSMLGLPVLGTDDQIASIAAAHGIETGLVAIGDNFVRQTIVDQIRRLHPAFAFATAIHPSAQIGDDVTIGPGTVVMAGTVINSGTHIGEFCIVNSSASVDHDNQLEDFASIAPGVVTGGNVIVRHAAAVGLGAHVVHGVEIGRDAVVGAGSVVVRSVPEQSVAYGVPARVIRSRNPGEPYL